MRTKRRSSLKEVNVAEGIIPLGVFKAQASRYLDELGRNDEPIVITQNGKPVAVVLSPASFEDIREEQSYLQGIAEGIEQADRGEVVEHDKVRDWLQSWGKKNERQPPG